MRAERGRAADDGPATNYSTGEGDEFDADPKSLAQAAGLCEICGSSHTAPTEWERDRRDRARRGPVAAERRPEHYGLTARELYLEALTLFANGVPLAEIRQMIALPDEVLR